MADFLVTQSFGSGKNEVLGVFSGTNGDDATGVAALAKERSGKLTAWPVSSAVTRQVSIDFTTTRVSADFDG